MSIVIKKLSKARCTPCAILSNALREIDFAAHGATLEEIDIATLSDAELDAYKIKGVPVLIAYRNGMEITRAKGVMAPEEIEDLINIAKEWN
ncbi:hypothetical protein GJU41_11825 [Bacillus idriensis]|uniref:Thioredoxin n=1 Tax=Metabacillus idriensis TaxID=324768 RepID=A0A6I2ME20_9BACI|nr:thioredoxin family protein [Metabacillus idriensis]MRX54661.1 hypothetical protein [Metabacillus idriensis]